MDRLDAVWSSDLPAEDGQAYDRFVAGAKSGHYSQRRSWARLAAASGTFAPSYFLARREGRVTGAALLLRTRRSGITLPFAQSERGPVCDDPQDLPAVLAALRRCALARGILRLSVMPYWAGAEKAQAEESLRRRGFRDRQSFAGRHVRTLRLALDTLPPDEPYAEHAPRQVRQNMRRAERAGATARPGRKQDMAAFRQMHEQLLGLEGKGPPPAAWYDAVADFYLAEGAIFVCEHEGKIISAIFVARHGTRATYVMGASSGEAARFPKMILPLAAAIAWARENGIESFDLGGIPMDGDSDAKRASIAEFKRSFSRHEIALVHEHVRWF